MKEFPFSESKLLDYLDKNKKRLIKKGSLKGIIVEELAAELQGSKFVDAVGHDEIHPELNRIENKMTDYIMPTGELRISNIGKSKRDKFDYLRIIDMVNEKEFLIPHDVFYNKAKLYSDSEFRWSSSYNKTDNLQINNTKLLLEYERI